MWNSQFAWDNAHPDDLLSEREKQEQVSNDRLESLVKDGVCPGLPLDFSDLARAVSKHESFDEALAGAITGNVAPLKALTRQCALDLIRSFTVTDEE